MPLVPMPYPLLILTLTRCGQYDIQKPTDTCWFALQCSVGFESALPVDTDLDTLIPLVMPWTLLGAHGAADPSTPTVIVRLTGLLVTAGGQFSPLSINPVAVIPTSSTNAFAKSLRKDATQRLMALAKDQPSSVLWKLADDAGPDEEEGGSLGKFLQYLGSLPGPVALHAGTVLYFSVPASELFNFDDSGVPGPKAETLWVAPSQIEIQGTQVLTATVSHPTNQPYFEPSGF